MQCKRRTCEPGKWAQCATCYAHKGNLHMYLHRYLGVPLDVHVTRPPYRSLLIKIKKTPIDAKVHHGAKSVTVTRKLKGMVGFALNMNP